MKKKFISRVGCNENLFSFLLRNNHQGGQKRMWSLTLTAVKTGFLRNFKYKFPDIFKTFSRLYPDFSRLGFSEWPTQVKYKHYNI